MAKDDISDVLISELIDMPKTIQNPNARAKVDGRHWKIDYSVHSTDGRYEFALFTRQSTRLATSYSAGLRWLRRDAESVMLMRCNGSSHEHTNAIEGSVMAYECHIHIATERYLSEGRRDEGYAEATGAYNDLRGALLELVTRCHIDGLKTASGRPFDAQLGLDLQ